PRAGRTRRRTGPAAALRRPRRPPHAAPVRVAAAVGGLIATDPPRRAACGTRRCWGALRSPQPMRRSRGVDPQSGRRRSDRLGVSEANPNMRAWNVQRRDSTRSSNPYAGPTPAIHPTHDSGKHGALGFTAFTPTYADLEAPPVWREAPLR